jgi:acetyl esterase/lipase
MKLTFIALLLCSVLSASAQQPIYLHNGKPTGSENWTWSEAVSEKNSFNVKAVYNVSKPSITAYLPQNPNGTAVIVAPGGAFHILSIDSEGVEVAKWLNEHGIAAFVLKYRVARSFTDDPMKELMGKMTDFKKLDAENEPIIPLATEDGIAALKYVRQHAAEFKIDPKKVGFMGFSAGGTLTMSVVYSAAEAEKPNFVAPIYAYENAIIGSDMPKAKTPIFIAVAGDDQLGFMPHSINIYRKWFDSKQPAELHIYEKGGHGFGMRKTNTSSEAWIEHFGTWLKMQGLMK